VITEGITTISIKKPVGILHDSDDNMVIAATNIRAKPIDVVIAASLLLPTRANTEDIENGSIKMPPTIATAIWACCVNRLKPKEHFLVSRAKIVEAGTCDAKAKKINIEPIILALTASIG
jgi:hypothetical protein